MKATVEIPDPLFRRAKAAAALQGRKFKDLVEEGLIRVLESPNEGDARPGPSSSAHSLMKAACGLIDSGVPDLGTNPDHMTGFGDDATGHR